MAEGRGSRLGSAIVPVLLAILVQQAIKAYLDHKSYVLRVDDSIPPSAEFSLGAFKVVWEGSSLSVWPSGDATDRRHSLWHTVPAQPFLSAATAVLHGDPIQDGHYHLKETLTARTREQSVVGFEHNPREGTLTLKGQLTGEGLSVPYTLSFFTDAEHPRSKLRFIVSLEAPDPALNRLILRYGSERQEAFFGFGQHYSYWDLKGRVVPVVISEQGVGRGLQPLTFALNTLLHGVGSSWHTTYVAKPVYMTSRLRALVLTNAEVSIFDLTRPNMVVAEVWATTVRGMVIRGDDPVDIVRVITTETGRMQPLPEWTQRGAIIGLEGGSAEAGNVTEVLLKHKAPLVGVWLQDWVGTRHDWDGTRLIWNWQVNLEYYPQWAELRARLGEAGVRVLTYMNPYLVDVAGRFPHRRNLFREAVEQGFLMKNGSGMPLIAKSGSIEFGTIDPTNPGTRAWLKAVIVEEMVRDAGSSGWMADFGEYVPFAAHLHEGRGEALHNLFPDYWASLQREAVEEARASGAGEGLLVFVRSGSLRTPGLAQLYWVGDQLVTWDGHDGIKTVLPAMLSGGLTGHSLSHSDVGGYTMIDHWAFKFFRSRELLFRWIELGAFAGAVFRSHLGSFMHTPSAQIWDDEESIEHFSRFARIFGVLAPYRAELMEAAAQHGTPLVRPMLMHHYPGDPLTLHLTTQFLLGRDLLVAPVLDPGRSRRRVYLPAVEGGWVHVWSSKLYGKGAKEGEWVHVHAELGHPPVFYRHASPHRPLFEKICQQ